MKTVKIICIALFVFITKPVLSQENKSKYPTDNEPSKHALSAALKLNVGLGIFDKIEISAFGGSSDEWVSLLLADITPGIKCNRLFIGIGTGTRRYSSGDDPNTYVFAPVYLDITVPVSHKTIDKYKLDFQIGKGLILNDPNIVPISGINSVGLYWSTGLIVSLKNGKINNLSLEPGFQFQSYSIKYTWDPDITLFDSYEIQKKSMYAFTLKLGIML